jgi:hypothetical protein
MSCCACSLAHVGRNDRVGGLNVRAALIEEYCAEKANLLHSVHGIVQAYAVADIVRVLDEQEDDGGQHLGQRAADQPTEPNDECSGSGNQVHNLGVLEVPLV